jgi:hypothetical protein
MTFLGMGKTKTKKQSDKDTLAEVTLEMAKPGVAMSARERDPDENRDSGRVTDDPMKLLREKVSEELATPSQAITGMSLTPNLNNCLKTLGVKATLIT